MDEMIYERPREKLLHSGTGALSLVELFQLVLGSGGARASAARLARSVQACVASGGVTYAALIAIPGMGHAKTCQILALLELTKRLQVAP